MRYGYPIGRPKQKGGPNKEGHIGNNSVMVKSQIHRLVNSFHAPYSSKHAPPAGSGPIQGQAATDVAEADAAAEEHAEDPDSGLDRVLRRETAQHQRFLCSPSDGRARGRGVGERS